MFRYSFKEVNYLSDKYNFNRNIVERVLRLHSFLRFINDSGLGEFLVLKGGTAINLFVLDCPRLSLDADFDFALPLDKNGMLLYRRRIDKEIKNYMEKEKYTLNKNSWFTNSLDSYSFSYATTSGAADVIKIDINYSNRIHVLKPVKRQTTTNFDEAISCNCLAEEELIGTKLNALLIRTTPRDIFDIYELNEKGYWTTPI